MWSFRHSAERRTASAAKLGNAQVLVQSRHAVTVAASHSSITAAVGTSAAATWAGPMATKTGSRNAKSRPSAR
jgi:hypothetical protein